MKKRALLLAALIATAPVGACPPYEVRVQVMDELLVKHPGTAVLWLRRGEANLMRGQPQLALNDLALARSFDPSLAQVDFHEGMALAQLKEPAQAERAFSRYLAAPLQALADMPVVKRLMGSGPLDLSSFIQKSREQVGDLVWRYQDGELTEMLCGETAFPEAAQAARVQSLEALGRKAEAEDLLAQLAREHPGPDFVLERARSMKGQGRLREALQTLNSGLATVGSLAVLEDEALDCELSLNEPSDALIRTRRLLASRPQENRAERLERQGFCLRALGQADAARRAYAAAQSALSQRPLRARESPNGQALSRRIELALH